MNVSKGYIKHNKDFVNCCPNESKEKA